MQKQDRQCFYTKKVIMLCVFLFFGLGSQLDGQGITGDNNQVVEPARREEINDLEEGQELNEKRLETSLTLLLLTKQGRREATDEQIDQLFGVFVLKKEQQTLWINENGTAEVTSPFLQQSWIIEEENAQKTSKIERNIQNKEECRICHMEFNKMKNKKIFVCNCDQKNEPHMFCHGCYISWCQNNNKNNQEETCPVCISHSVPGIPEDTSKEGKIRKLKNARNISYIERNQQEQSHWKLYLRNKYYDEIIWYETSTNLDNWLIVDGALSDMEVLEINLNKPKALDKYHLKIMKKFKFQKVKFKDEQEPRKLYLVVESKTRLKTFHNGRILFHTRKHPAVDCLTVRGFKTKNFERDSLGRVICRYKCARITRSHDYNDHIFVFKKENIEYLKETKGLVIFDLNLKNVLISLKGNEIISEEDIEDVFIINGDIGLICDNANNFKAMQASDYFLSSPTDLLKINQINEMRKDGYKLPISSSLLALVDDNCFLLPLFTLISRKKLTISLNINPETAEREIAPYKKELDELKETFSGLKIEGEKIWFRLQDYAIVVLFYFDENSLNVLKVTLIIQTIEYCDIWGELTREGGPVLKSQTLTNQNVKKLSLIGECFDFAVNAKMMESIQFQRLKMKSETTYINEGFICNNENDQAIMRNGLEKLTLYEYAIKYLLYFKGITHVDKLEVFVSGLTIEGCLWMSEVLERARTKNTQFLLPTRDCLLVAGLNKKEIAEELNNGIVAFTRGI